MAFTDVPDDLPDRPLTDPVLVADVLDLVVPERDRHHGALAVLLCDDEARLRVPVLVGELADRPSRSDRERVLTSVMAPLAGRGSVLVAVARRDGLSLRPEDHLWAQAAADVCATGPRLLGVHVVTLDGSREVVRPQAA